MTLVCVSLPIQPNLDPYQGPPLEFQQQQQVVGDPFQLQQQQVGPPPPQLQTQASYGEHSPGVKEMKAAYQVCTPH